MESLKRIDDWLAKIESGCVIATLSLMIVFSFGQMLLRNLFNSGIPWADVLLRQMVLWVGFLGASLATRSGRHISIDILSPLLPPDLKHAVGIAVRIAAGTVGAVLTWAAWKFMMFERAGGSTLFLGFPVWIFQAILPFSFAVTAFRFLFQALSDIFGERPTPGGERETA